MGQAVSPRTALATAILATNVTLTSFAQVATSQPLPDISIPVPAVAAAPPAHNGENASYFEADAYAPTIMTDDPNGEAPGSSEAVRNAELKNLVERVGDAVNKPSKTRELLGSKLSGTTRRKTGSHLRLMQIIFQMTSLRSWM